MNKEQKCKLKTLKGRPLTSCQWHMPFSLTAVDEIQTRADYDHAGSSQVRRSPARPPTFWLHSVLADERCWGGSIVPRMAF